MEMMNECHPERSEGDQLRLWQDGGEYYNHGRTHSTPKIVLLRSQFIHDGTS